MQGQALTSKQAYLLPDTLRPALTYADLRPRQTAPLDGQKALVCLHRFFPFRAVVSERWVFHLRPNGVLILNYE